MLPPLPLNDQAELPRGQQHPGESNKLGSSPVLAHTAVSASHLGLPKAPEGATTQKCIPCQVLNTQLKCRNARLRGLKRTQLPGQHLHGGLHQLQT